MQPEENSFEAQNPKNPEDIEDKRKQILLTTPTKNNREFQVSRNLYSQNIKKSGPLVTEFLEPLSVKRRQTMNLSINQDDRENSAICQTPIGSNFECEDKEKFIYQKIIKNTRVSAFENVVERGLFSKEIEYLEPVKNRWISWTKDKNEYRRNSYILQQMPPLTQICTNSPSNPSSELPKKLKVLLLDSDSKQDANNNNSMLCSSEIEPNKVNDITESLSACSIDEGCYINHKEIISKVLNDLKTISKDIQMKEDNTNKKNEVNNNQKVVKSTKKNKKKKKVNEDIELKIRKNTAPVKHNNKENSVKFLVSKFQKNLRSTNKRKATIANEKVHIEEEKCVSRNLRERKAKRKRINSDSSLDDYSDFNSSEEGMLPCPYCGKKFSSQGLGGHKAKAHKGLNFEYQQKLEIRRKNKNNLDILRLAQFQYKFDHNCMNIESSKIPRSYIIKNKLMIVNQIEEIKHEQGFTTEEAIKEIRGNQEKICSKLRENNVNLK